MRWVPLSTYGRYNLRICRGARLTDARIGTRYDLCNIFDLLRGFLPEPPVPLPRCGRRSRVGAGTGRNVDARGAPVRPRWHAAGDDR